jgi:hypothetical protein
MVTKMKKTKCMGTSKNKRAMSGGGGGKGRVSRYTKKFKKCYENFSKIAESDTDDVKNDDTKIRKMEEWGRLRGIYTYLKSKKLEGDEKTFLEKMEENLKDKYGNYTGAISCFENDSTIFLEKGCVLEKDYVNSKESMDIPIVEPKKTDVPSEAENADTEADADAVQADAVVQPKADAIQADAADQPEAAAVSNEASDNTANQEPPAENDNNAEDSAPVSETPTEVTDVSNEAGEAENDNATNDTTNQEPPAENDNDTNQEPPAEDSAPVATAEVTEATADFTEATADVPSDADYEKQDGGRSKRRQKYSRRRGKSMKSKKGRRTRRR